jgi:hypothetical protein
MSDELKSESPPAFLPLSEIVRDFPAVAEKFSDRLLGNCGYLLVMVSVVCFGVVAFIQFRRYQDAPIHYERWLDLVQHETSTISLVLIALFAASLGRRLLTTVQLAQARTIPSDDLELIRQAVMDGKSEPIDQYVRLRSLSGIAGNFTKIGLTGLPLTTVFLTLVFSLIALLPIAQAKDFLDLAKLTLGAFIGSFVQRQVEQRQQQSLLPPGTPRKPDLPT